MFRPANHRGMIHLVIVLCALFFSVHLLPAQSQENPVLVIPAGDSAALVRALEQANQVGTETPLNLYLQAGQYILYAPNEVGKPVLPVITGAVNLFGQNTRILLYSETASPAHMVISQGARVELHHLQLLLASGTGRAVINHGTLHVYDGNFGSRDRELLPGIGEGGGIENHGELIIERTTFARNQYLSTNTEGGAIHNAGSLNATCTRFVEGLASRGGAIFNTGTATLFNSAFEGNTANGGGAIFSAEGTVNASGNWWNGFTPSVNDLYLGTDTISTGVSAESALPSDPTQDGTCEVQPPVAIPDEIPAPPAPAAPQTFVVTTTADSGAGSLRQAILDANATTDTDTITFNIPAGACPGGICTITPVSDLPIITNPVTLDGTTQSGASCPDMPRIAIRRDGDYSGSLHLNADASGSQIKGLALYGLSSYPAIWLDSSSHNTLICNFVGIMPDGVTWRGSGNGIEITNATHNRIGTDGDGVDDLAERNLIAGQNAILITGAGSTHNRVSGNYLNMEINGDHVLSNTDVDGFSGVVITSDASYNLVGTDGIGADNHVERNLIAALEGSTGRMSGVFVSQAHYNTIAGNYIGTNKVGDTSSLNVIVGTYTYTPFAGIWVTNGSTHNLIGTNSDNQGDSDERNVIAGYASNQIRIGDAIDSSYPPSQYNQVSGNYVGINAAGTAAVVSDYFWYNGGVHISTGASHNVVGTNGDGMNDLGERNVIAGNAICDVCVVGDDNRVSGNYIGVNAAGTDVISAGNPYRTHIAVGELSSPALRNIIGTNGDGISDEWEGNLISGKSNSPIGVTGSGSSDNRISGNIIGLSSDQSAVISTNAIISVSAHHTLIGSNNDGISDELEGNIIAAQLAAEIRIVSDGAVGNRLSRNRIYAAGAIGIDLNGDSITPNDIGDGDIGPNNLQNYPVLTSLLNDGETVIGTLNSTPNRTFRLEFFANEGCAVASHTAGQTYIGALNVSTDASGDVPFSIGGLPLVFDPQGITATATDTVTGDTSEFSGCITTSETIYIVENINDSGVGSLRQAILDANSTPDMDTITFDPTVFVTPQTINLSSNLPTITTSMIIDGPDSAQVTINAGNVSGRRVFTINGRVLVELLDLTIMGGNCVDSCLIEGLYGGGIFATNATVTLANSTFSGNKASSGGGIYSVSGGLSVTNTTFSGNSAEDGGGGIYTGSEARINGSTFNDNTAYEGGGISVRSSIRISDTVFSANSGGGIFVIGINTTISNSVFSNNVGGGIQINYGSGLINNCVFSGNSGGGIFYYAPPPSPRSLIINNSTFSGNSTNFSGGAIANRGPLTINNSTISGNSANFGGGIFNQGELWINNSTISGNLAGDYGGGIFISGPTRLSNSIVAGNTAANGPNIWGTLIQVANSITSGDPLLAPLGFYGGATQTQPPLPGSPAIDAGDTTICAAEPISNLDQRGVARPMNGTCDIGAVESRGFTLVITGGDNQSTPINTVFTNPLVVSVASAFNEPIDGGVITFDAPDTGASLSVITPQPVAIAGGVASLIVTANNTAGAYVVPVAVSGAEGVSFGLSNNVVYPPQSVTQISPSGNITSRTPTFTWNAAPGAQSYAIAVVKGGSQQVFQGSYPQADVCTGNTCSVTPALDLDADNYDWYIGASNAVGEGPWSYQGFRVNILPPMVTQTGPSGSITSRSPVFTWNSHRDALWYGVVLVKGGSQVIFQEWRTRTEVCTGDTCTLNLPLDLDADNYDWYIGAYNPSGEGQWTYQGFRVNILPPMVSQTGPSGSISSRSPVFTWNSHRDALWYGVVLVKGGSQVIFEQWRTRAEICTGNICTLNLLLDLDADNYDWYIGAYNPSGEGPWTYQGFQVSLVPGATTLISPSGVIVGNQPTLTWGRNRDAIFYGIYVYSLTGGATILQEWRPSSEVCSGDTCTRPLPAALPSGDYRWYVGGIGVSGEGPWLHLDFTVQ